MMVIASKRALHVSPKARHQSLDKWIANMEALLVWSQVEDVKTGAIVARLSFSGLLPGESLRTIVVRRACTVFFSRRLTQSKTCPIYRIRIDLHSWFVSSIITIILNASIFPVRNVNKFAFYFFFISKASNMRYMWGRSLTFLLQKSCRAYIKFCCSSVKMTATGINACPKMFLVRSRPRASSKIYFGLVLHFWE